MRLAAWLLATSCATTLTVPLLPLPPPRSSVEYVVLSEPVTVGPECSPWVVVLIDDGTGYADRIDRACPDETHDAEVQAHGDDWSAVWVQCVCRPPIAVLP